MSDLTVDWLLSGRPDLHVVYRHDHPLGERDFDALGDVLHALEIRFLSANFSDGMVVVHDDPAVADEWADRIQKIVEAVSR